MKVLLPAVSASCKPDGVSRHAANLARCLLLNSGITQVDLVVGQWQIEAMRSIVRSSDSRLRVSAATTGHAALARNHWYWSQLPKLARKLQSDIVHATYPVPLNRRAFGCSVVVTLHDLYPYDAVANFGFPRVLANRVILQQCLRAADVVACVSESTLRRLDIYSPGMAAQKAVTIYNCVEFSAVTATESPFLGWRGGKFLLCVAQHRRNKNIPLAIRTFRRLIDGGDIAADAQLLILGIEGPETQHIRGSIREASLQDNVVLLRGISDAELDWCYANCELLLAPSLVEGFGFPVVEAMLRHCPVVCSDIPAFREVGGSYCHYADLRISAEDDFVHASRIALSSHRFRVARTECFSSGSVAEACLKLYTRLHNQAHTGSNHGPHPHAASLERGRL